MTKEKPILMSAPMVLATLSGVKTMTRRVVMPQPVPASFAFRWKGREIGEKAFCLESPYGQAGQLLWVRETFVSDGDYVDYRADQKTGCGVIWKPSIFMPRWASRITLEIVSVRVERLNQISEEDARAEGCTGMDAFTKIHVKLPPIPPSAKAGFQTLWDGLNAKRGFPFESAPFVWVLEFRRIKP